VESILRPGTRHLGRVSSATVDVGLDAFFLDRALPLVMGLDSRSRAEERLAPELRVRGGMRGGSSKDAWWRVGGADR
jgi:hypothetical protein